MNVDRELLEMAAKAAGLDDAEWQDMGGWGEARYGYSHAMWAESLNEAYGTGYWNPLEDDGDALRLAVKLREKLGTCVAHCFGIGRYAQWDVEPYAATRRAIVTAAAAIGRAAP